MMATPIENNTAALNALLDKANALPDGGGGAVLYTPQELTAEQQAQARSNIGALAETELDAAVEDALEQAKASGDFKGEKGDTGAAGANGVSATHSWNGTVLTVTSASGTSSADLKGDKGDKGDTGSAGAAGAAGKTPVKGTDYWTAEDRAAIVNDVLAALPTWDGGSY